MTFVKKYTDDDFLAVLSVNTPQTTTYIAKQTGAGRNTAIRFLTDLEKTGKVARVEIEGGFYAWVRTEQNEIVIEGTIPENGYIITEHPGKHFKLLIYRNGEKKEEKEQ